MDLPILGSRLANSEPGALPKGLFATVAQRRFWLHTVDCSSLWWSLVVAGGREGGKRHVVTGARRSGLWWREAPAGFVWPLAQTLGSALSLTETTNVRN